MRPLNAIRLLLPPKLAALVPALQGLLQGGAGIAGVEGGGAAAGGGLDDGVRLGTFLDVFGATLQGNVISVKRWGFCTR